MHAIHLEITRRGEWVVLLESASDHRSRASASSAVSLVWGVTFCVLASVGTMAMPSSWARWCIAAMLLLLGVALLRSAVTAGRGGLPRREFVAVNLADGVLEWGRPLSLRAGANQRVRLADIDCLWRLWDWCIVDGFAGRDVCVACVTGGGQVHVLTHEGSRAFHDEVLEALAELTGKPVREGEVEFGRATAPENIRPKFG